MQAFKDQDEESYSTADAEVWEKEFLLQGGNNRCCHFPHDLLPGNFLLLATVTASHRALQ